MKKLSPWLFALLLTGCATGFNRPAIEQRLAGKQVQYDSTDIRDALAKKPQIRFPIRIAVQMVSESYSPTSRYNDPANSWRWSTEDKKVLEGWADSLRKSGIASDIFVMSELVSSSGDLANIRLAAAKHGADVVLLIKGVAQVDSYVNASSILNLLILPGWIVPSSHRDVLLMVQGAMWDVANEYLYLSVDAEAEVENVGPTFLIKTDDVINKAKKKALADFGQELITRMQGLKNGN